MKSYAKVMLSGVIILAVIIILALMYQIWFSGPEDRRIREARVETQVENIYWYSTAYKVAFVVVLAVLLISMLIVSYSIAKSKLKKAAVHTYKIGQYNEVVVHEKDLSLAAPIAMGLMNAEQLKQMNGGIERAFELYNRMAEMQTKQIQALVGRKGIQPGVPDGSLFQETQEVPASSSEQIPTFQELLTSGDIARGKPMILGYENGQPRQGSFMDIYSAAVAGESGSGKTATLLFLIGSGLVSQPIQFVGIDPHYPHPKSLGFKTKPLWETGLMRMATYKDDMLALLDEVEKVIDRRLKQLDKETMPIVLVIDELAFLTKTSIGPAVAHTMERISTEGRKCAVYMLASSQTWLVSRTGPSSVVRDTLTSAYVHRIKPKQANLLLQDKDEASKVKKYVKQAGEALLCPVNDDSVVCKMPFTTETDMRVVAEMLKSDAIDVTPLDEVKQDKLTEEGSSKQLPETSKTVTATKVPEQTRQFDPKLLTVDILRERMEASPLDEADWTTQLSKNSGVSESLIGNLIAGKKKLTTRTAKKLLPYIFSEDV